MAAAKNTHPLGESHNYYSSRANPPPPNNNETTSLTWETDNTKLTRQLIVPKNSWFEAEKSQPATAQEQWQPLYQPKIGR